MLYLETPVSRGLVTKSGPRSRSGYYAITLAPPCMARNNHPVTTYPIPRNTLSAALRSWAAIKTPVQAPLIIEDLEEGTSSSHAIPKRGAQNGPLNFHLHLAFHLTAPLFFSIAGCREVVLAGCGLCAWQCPQPQVRSSTWKCAPTYGIRFPGLRRATAWLRVENVARRTARVTHFRRHGHFPCLCRGTLLQGKTKVNGSGTDKCGSNSVLPLPTEVSVHESNISGVVSPYRKF